MNLVDVLFNVNPNLSEEERISLEEAISANNGVMHVAFNERLSHELNVSYDPDAIHAETILEQIRDWDKDAKMIGL